MEKYLNISFEYYKIFYYVARYQNVTLAANVLLCNQPNITRTIKKLERELDCTLFVRSNRGVRLTPEGEKLYSHVKIAVEQIAAAEEELRKTKELQNGVVSVGATEIALHTFLLPVLNGYRRRFPGIRLNIANYTATQAIDALKGGLVDIAAVTLPAGERPRDLAWKELRKVQETAVCGQYFSELAVRERTLRELSEYPLISLGSKTKTYEMYSQWYSRNGLVFSPVIETATADQILPMVRNNLGIGFVPEDFLDGGGRQGVYRILLAEEIPKRTVLLLKRSDGALSVAAQALEKLIIEGGEYRND